MKPERQAARILLCDAEKRILLFHFAYDDGPLAGADYWGVPGGGVEEGETAEEGAIRELREETGLRVDALGPVVATSSYDFRLSGGRLVRARDSYFLLRLSEHPPLSKDGFTPEEAAHLDQRRWWSLDELAASDENIIPADLAELLAGIL